MPLSVLSVAYPFAPVGPDAVGGAEQVLTALDTALTARGHHSIVIACEESLTAGELVPMPLPQGALTERARADTHRAVKRCIEDVVARTPVDVIHMHAVDFQHHLPTTHVPVLVTLHLPIELYPADVLRDPGSATYFHCVSSAQRATVPEGVALLPDIPNGVSLERFTVRGDVEDYLLVLGRICPEKGIHLALDAAHRANARLLVAGRVFPYPTHERYFRDQVLPRLDARRRFVGPMGMGAKASLLSRARAVLVPSLVPETSSLVAMEALASGTPVVAFRRGALPDVVEHGRTGFVVDDVHGLAHAIERVHELDRAACRQAAETRFSDRQMIARYIETYAHIIEGRARSRPAGVSTAPELAVDVLREPALLHELRGEWVKLWERCPDATTFQRPEWLLPWCEQLMQGELNVVTFRRAGRLVGLAPWFTWQAGEERVLSMLGAGVCDYQDVLFDPRDPADAASSLAAYLDGASEVTRCMWSELLPSSALCSVEPNRSALSELELQEACPALRLPADAQELALAFEPHFARNLGTARRRAERAGGMRFAGAAEVGFDALFDGLVRLHLLRRGAHGDRGALEDEPRVRFYRAAARELLEADLLELTGAYLSGELVAVALGFREHATVRLLMGGFDPAHAFVSPLSLLIAHVMERAIERGAQLCDFMRGTESYKYRWGARDRITLVRRTLEVRAQHD